MTPVQNHANRLLTVAVREGTICFSRNNIVKTLALVELVHNISIAVSMKVKVGNDQETAKSERHPHSKKPRREKKLN